MQQQQQQDEKYRKLLDENERLKTEIKLLRRESAMKADTGKIATDSETVEELPKIVPRDIRKDDISRYCRQMTLRGIGVEGEKKLLASSVLIVGAGGLGSPIFLVYVLICLLLLLSFFVFFV